MADHQDLVVEEIAETLERAGFHTLSMELFHVEVTNSFQRKLGECRMIQAPDELFETEQFQIRVARRLFEDDYDVDWRDTVRHEVAHAYVFAEHGKSVKPHGEKWKAAAAGPVQIQQPGTKERISSMRTTCSRARTAVSNGGISSAPNASSFPGITVVRTARHNS